MSNHIDTLFSILVYQYFAPPNCFILISDSSLHLLNIPLGVVSINVDVSHNISNLVFHNFGCENFVLNVANSKDVFDEVENLIWNSIDEKFNNRRYIIFDSGFDVFSSAVIRFVADVILVQVDLGDSAGLLVKGDMVASFWTHHYATKFKFLDKWFSHNKSFLLQNNLFYDKIQQQDGKKILAGVFDYRPYVIINKELNITSGIEVRLLKEISKYMNASLTIVVQKDFWGNVYRNESSYGLRGNLYLDKLDVGAAGLFMTYTALENFDLSSYYLNAELTCLVPAPRLAATWLSPTYSFLPHIWLYLSLTFAALILFIYALNFYQINLRKSNTILRLISKTTLLVNSIESVCKPLLNINFSKKSYYFKPLLGLVLLSTLIICAAYSAGFASVLTKPFYESSINTMEDFLNSDIYWGGVQTADYITSWASSEQEQYRKAAQRYIATTSDHLKRIFINNRNFAFKVERVNGHYHVSSYILEQAIENYVTMKDPIQTQYVVLTFRKNSILLPLANRIIGRLVDSGIILYWTNEFSGHKDYVMKQKLQFAKIKHNSENVALTLSHVISAFMIVGIGNLIASIVFIFELLFKLKKIY